MMPKSRLGGWLALLLSVVVLAINGCGGSSGVARGFDTPIVANPAAIGLQGSLNPTLLNFGLPVAPPQNPFNNNAQSFTLADGFFAAFAGLTGTVTINSNGLALGAPGGTEPTAADVPLVIDPDNVFTPKPPTISNRGNIDFLVQLQGVPAALNTVAPTAENNNPFYWSRTSPPPNDPPPADNRPFRSDTIVGGSLQLWMMARVQPPFTTTAPPVGERQQLFLFYRGRADAGGIAGSLRGFSNPAGAPPAGVQSDDFVVRIPGTFPTGGGHPLGGTSLLPPLRVIGLPVIPAARIVNGVVNFRFFVLSERILDAAHSGGFEIAVAPRNVIATPAGQPDFQLVLLRTGVAAIESLRVEEFIQGMTEFGLAMSLEPPAEETVNLILRNPIDLAVFRP